MSAASDPGGWEQFSIRVPASLKARLGGVFLAERARTGRNDLAECHIVQAALEVIPADTAAGDIGQAVAWGQKWLGTQETREVAGSRLRSGTAQQMRDLAEHLRVRRCGVKSWMVAAEALTRVLDRLEAGR